MIIHSSHIVKVSRCILKCHSWVERRLNADASLLIDGFFFFFFSRQGSPPRSSEVSNDGMCAEFYQVVLRRRDQPVRFDKSVSSPHWGQEVPTLDQWGHGDEKTREPSCFPTAGAVNGQREVWPTCQIWQVGQTSISPSEENALHIPSWHPWSSTETCQGKTT